MQLTNLEEYDGEPDGKLQGPTFILRFMHVIEELKITADRDLISRIGKYLYTRFTSGRVVRQHWECD
jgi:hypothetical protein